MISTQSPPKYKVETFCFIGPDKRGPPVLWRMFLEFITTNGDPRQAWEPIETPTPKVAIQPEPHLGRRVPPPPTPDVKGVGEVCLETPVSPSP